MIYAALGIVICVLFTFYSIHTEKTIVNPLTVFCCIWSVVLFFSCLCYYTLYEPESSTYNIILIGIVSFIAGYYSIKVFGKTITFNTSAKDKTVTVLNYQLVYFFAVICILTFLWSLINVVRQISGFNLRNIQLLLQSSEYESNSSPFWNALSLLIVQPASFAIAALAAADFWAGRRDKKLFWFTIIMLFIRLLSSANRTTLMSFIIYIIVIGILKNSKKRQISRNTDIDESSVTRRKNRKMIIQTIIVGLCIFVIMTMSRGSRIFRNLYLNFAMPPEMLELWCKQVDDSYLIGYGMASLNGFLYPIMYILKNVLGLSSLPGHFQDIYNLTMLTDTSWQWIGTTIRANAYVSVYWFLYLDGRWIGVAIGMFIYGGVLAGSFKKVVKNMSAKQLSVYCLMFYGILYSLARMPFTLSKYTLAIVFIVFFAYKKKPIKE